MTLKTLHTSTSTPSMLYTDTDSPELLYMTGTKNIVVPWSLSPLHSVGYIKPQRKQTLLLLISLITLVYMTVIFLTISVAVQIYTKMSQD